MEKYIIHNNATLNYVVSGGGPKAMLCFHGFGQDHRAFDLRIQALHQDYTIYAFDLYFHGKSEWRYGEEPLEKEFWKDVVEKFLEENKINKFSLAGFSLGCRFVLATAESFPDKTEKIFLLAPDGIKTSFWFSISTYPFLFRKIFKSLIHHPGGFKTIVSILYNLRLMDRGLLKFAQRQMNTEDKRRKVYYSWVVFRHLKFNLKKLVQLINEHHIPVTIVVGRQDRVITAANMMGLVRQFEKCRFEILDIGHTGLLKNPLLIEVFKDDLF